jgi:hypothetical protein
MVARASCCQPPSQSLTASACARARSRSTAASPSMPPTTRSPTLTSSSPADNTHHHADPRSDWPATGPAAKAASATSNAARACAEPGLEATTARDGPAGRSSPTTSTPSPSRPPDTLPAGALTPRHQHAETAAPRAAVSFHVIPQPRVLPGQIANRCPPCARSARARGGRSPRAP